MAKRFNLLVLLTAFCLFGTTALMAQVPTWGRLIGTVTDQTGAVIAGADVKVRDDATGAVIETQAGADGQFSVGNLKPGMYTVSVTMQGFKAAEFRAVKIIVGQTYDLQAKMEVGAVESTVVVEAGAEVLETASPTVGTTITGKSLTQLPFTSRDALDLAILMPGAATTGRVRQTSFMGLPKGSINITYDGINAQDNILKSSDGFFTTIRPRVDSVDEFSISTAAAGSEQAGEGAVQIRFETKRGGNDFHGGVWWYHRNDFLNANYWFTNLAGLPRQRMRLNQFGYKIGGPIWKDKIFFFHAYDIYKKPDSVTRTRTILTDEAAQGIFRYTTTSSFTTTAASPLATWMNCGGAFVPGFVGTVPSGTSCAATLLGIAGSLAATAGTTNVLDTVTSSWINTVNSVVGQPGVGLNPAPSPWQRSISFNNTSSSKRLFPDFRFDWNITKNHQFTAIYHFGNFIGFPDTLNGRDRTYPVAPFDTNQAGQNSNRNQFTGAWRWNMAANKSNELRFGVVSAPVWFFLGQKDDVYPQLNTNVGPVRVLPNTPGMSNPFLPFGAQPRNTALGQLIETFSWSKGKHNIVFGGSLTHIRGGILFDFAKVGSLTLGLSSFDPAFTRFSATASYPGSSATDRGNAQSLYAFLAGRVTAFSATAHVDDARQNFVLGGVRREKYRQTEFGIYGTDNWRIHSTLTFNYGVRWELQRSPYDTNDMYFELTNGQPDLFGISGDGNLFKPGTLTGSYPQFRRKGSGRWYDDDMNNFAPSIGLAYQPNFDNKIWNTLFGGPGKTVFRAGYAINFTREGTNNFLSISESNPGYAAPAFTSASTAAGPGTFVAGSIQVQSLNVTNVQQIPTTYSTTQTIDTQRSFSVNVYNQDIGIPVVHSWSVGIQREITPNMVVEVRYVGNHGQGLWHQYNLNETNIFENGFLQEFGLAQQNLTVCLNNATLCRNAQVAAGLVFANTTSSNFGYWGLAGQSPLPIMTAAFTGTANTGVPAAASCPTSMSSTLLNQCNSNFASGTFVTQLGLSIGGGNSTPVPGSFADTIAGNLTLMCNLAGTTAMGTVSGCPTSPATGLYPVNFFRVNPHARGGTWIMTNDSHSTYNGLQIEVRRRMSKGFQFSGNYTFSKSLTNAYADSSVSGAGFSTLRNKGYNKGISPWDLRHQYKFNGIWELPFGPGRKWSSNYGWVNRVIEGWELSGIHRWQSGRVFVLSGGLGGTVNGNDGGVELLGITPKQIQDSLTIRKLPNGNVYWFPAALLDSSQQRANSSVIRACRTAGQFCNRIYLYGPSFFRVDINVVKRTKITERVNFEFRAEFLNAFNNINFFFPGGSANSVNTAGLQSTSFGRITAAYQDLSTTDDPGGRIVQIVLRVNF